MLTVPLSMTGALLALKLTGQSMNVYSQIGLVTLVGLITKHGILIVEFANQLQEQGRAKLDAVVEAATLRLRPILMTTGAMVLGSVPLALATGAGAESRQAIGWVIVGGLLLGTLLTLYVVPTAYMLLARTHRPAEAARAGPGRAGRIGQGISRVEPVVARPSSARCAASASASGKRWWISILTAPVATTSNRSLAQASSSSRVRV